jgi:anti-sigma factor RsiW
MAFELDPESDVCWLALRYVSGEMGPDEAEAFERRLDQDQAAREAVAEAVALAGAIAALSPADRVVLPSPLARRPFRMVVGGLALAAAASLAWMLVGPNTWSSKAPVRVGEPHVAAGTARPSVLVTLAWSEFRQEREAEESGANELPDLPEADLAPPAEVDDASDHGLPPWLLDAASLAGRPGTGTVAVPVKEL